MLSKYSTDQCGDYRSLTTVCFEYAQLDFEFVIISKKFESSKRYCCEIEKLQKKVLL